jgi:(2Fe-2S) ferredoxin
MSANTDPELFYRIHAFICTNRRADDHPRGSCAARGSEPLRDYLKAAAKKKGVGGVRVNAAGCLDRCELGPVLVIYPEGIWYGFNSREDIDEIIDTHLLGGGRVTRLMLTPDQK